MVNKPKICKICDLPNSYDSKRCSKCGKPLTLDIALELEEKENEEKQSLLKRIEDLESKNKLYNKLEPDLKQLALQVFEELFDKIEYTKNKQENIISR